MGRNPDYLIVGSGLASLVFGSLAAKSGKVVHIIEAHEFAGGFGHTFEMANKYKFNAQFHYVWNCGEGETVNQVLKKLNLEEDVKFNRYNPDGFDHMYIPGYNVKIPSDTDELIRRLVSLFPDHEKNIVSFLREVNIVAKGLDSISYPIDASQIIKNLKPLSTAFSHLKKTLQQVFDQFDLPLEVQALLASQWPDFLLPPDKLSFYAWVMLFTGYQRGAYYPEKHFEHVIDSLTNEIVSNGGRFFFETEVTNFILEKKVMKGVKSRNLKTGHIDHHLGKTVICNMDPQKAARMIGMHKFSKKIRKRLDFEYSPSNFMAYCVVKDLDLRKFGFGEWNTFHSGHKNINHAFHNMYDNFDYSNPSFAITTPTLLTNKGGDCPPNHQIVELLTVANYEHWKQLKIGDQRIYKNKKMEILDAMLDVLEKEYIPGFRNHLVFKMTGSPTTNERYCWCPQGNSYGSNMTPKNIGPGRLNHKTSLKNFYFCNASSGFAGFAGTFWTGATLYERLTGDKVLF